LELVPIADKKFQIAYTYTHLMAQLLRDDVQRRFGFKISYDDE